MKPFLRWAGSKRQLLLRLTGYWPGDHVRYVEPFAGSACLFFHLQPSQAVLGDMNWELIITMRAVQSDVSGVLSYLRGLPRGSRAYYRIRSVNPRTLGEIQVAARFIYLNRFCFNGLYRTNTWGEFNVPYGPPTSHAEFDEDLIGRASQLLQRVSFVHGDFEKTVAVARSGDFVYLDPPYVLSTRRVFAEYGPQSFSSTDLPRLQTVLHSLDAKGVTFVITYADSREGRCLLAKWNPVRVQTRRNIAGFAADRRKSYELFATNSPVGEASDAD